jgi:O-Antigen ligase
MHPLLLVAPALVVALALDQGGFDPSAWVWSGALAAWAAATAAVTWRELRLSSASAQWVASACALLAWTAASWLWSDRRAQTVLEVRRTAVYAAAVLALVVLVRRGNSQRVLVLTHAAIAGVVAYALARYLIEPRAVDPFEGTLLSQPLGYANALAALAAIGLVLAVGLVASAEWPLARAVLAAPVPVLAAALPLTHSRGAAVALTAGLAVVVLCTDDASPLVRTAIVVAPGAALAAIVSALSRLGDANATPHAHAAWAVGGTTVACVAGTVLVATRGGAATRARRSPKVAIAAALACATAGAAAATGLTQPRASLWGVAWHGFASHVAGGSGAGTFAVAWARSGLVESRGGALDAHSLYLETLAELGAVGLIVLLAFLALPLARVSRLRTGNAPIAAGAYVVFLVHAGIDWDWEMPAVVLAGLCCGCVALANVEDEPKPAAPAGRVLIVTLALALAALSIAGARSSAEPGVTRRLPVAVLGARLAAIPVVVPVTLPVLLPRRGLGGARRERVAVAQMRLDGSRRDRDQVPGVLLRMRAMTDLHAVLLARRAVLVFRRGGAVLVLRRGGAVLAARSLVLM